MAASSVNLRMIEKYSKALVLITHGIISTESLLGYIELLVGNIKKNIDICKVFASPIIAKSDKMLLLKDLCSELKIPSVLESFLAETIDNKRADNIIEILEYAKKNILMTSGKKFINITSSYDLDIKEKQKIEAVIGGEEKGNCIINYNIDESIFGGLIISDDVTTYDDSIKNKLLLLAAESEKKI